MFLEHVPRVFASLQQARDSVKAAANGFHGQLRIALSDCITPSCFSALLALCRQEEPEIEIRLSEVPLSQQIKGLHDDLYDVGFAQLDEAGDGLIAKPVWHDPLMVAVPARHPLLAYKHLPLDEVQHAPPDDRQKLASKRYRLGRRRTGVILAQSHFLASGSENGKMHTLSDYFAETRSLSAILFPHFAGCRSAWRITHFSSSEASRSQRSQISKTSSGWSFAISPR